MLVTANVASGEFDLKLIDRTVKVECNRIFDCRSFSEDNVVRYELREIGVTMTGGHYTVVYDNFSAGGACASSEGMETPFFVKAGDAVKLVDDGYLRLTKGNCPDNGVWLDANLFGDIKDARQVVFFNKNKKDVHWKVERLVVPRKSEMSEFYSLTNEQREYAELHIK
jgi:hypothetical protein